MAPKFIIPIIFILLMNLNLITTFYINFNPFYDWIRSTTSKTSLRWRKLIGSNCIKIERGEIPPYYDCLGNIIIVNSFKIQLFIVILYAA